MAATESLNVLLRVSQSGGNVAKNLGEQLDGLKRVAGKNSLSGELADVLTGRGVIGGLVEMVELTGRAAANAFRLADAWMQGGANLRAQIAELVRGIPIARSFYDAAGAFDDAFLGGGERKRARAEKDRVRDFLKAEREEKAAANEAFESILTGLRRRIVGGRIEDPAERKQFDLRAQFEADSKALEKTAESARWSLQQFTDAGRHLSLAFEEESRRLEGERVTAIMREVNDNMTAVADELSRNKRNEQLATIGGRIAGLTAQRDGIAGTIAGIDERAGVGRANFITRGSAGAERVQQDIETKRAEAADRKRQADLLKEVSRKLDALNLIERHLQNGSGGGVIVLDQF